MRGHARLPLMMLLAAATADPAAAVTQNASVNANVIKPLKLMALQNLDLGTITLTPGTWSGATVGISRTGVVSCSSDLICSGAPQVARFKVTGTNRMVVLITASDVTLTNQSDASQTLTLKIDNPGQVALTSSGQPGSDFDLGGWLTLSSTTVSGVYSGTIEVTVDYQ
jgi:spore coat protein U-like protein